MSVLKKRNSSGGFDIVEDFNLSEQTTNKVAQIPEDDGTHIFSATNYTSVRAVVAHVAGETNKAKASAIATAKAYTDAAKAEIDSDLSEVTNTIAEQEEAISVRLYVDSDGYICLKED